jgi:hypothetical protein
VAILPHPSRFHPEVLVRCRGLDGLGFAIAETGLVDRCRSVAM